MPDLTPQNALEVCVEYFTEQKYQFATDEDSIAINLHIGLSFMHNIMIQAYEDKVGAYTIIAQSIPEGFEEVSLMLYRVSDGRLQITDEGEYIWVNYFDPSELASSEEVDQLLFWMNRELFMAECILDQFILYKTKPTCTLTGFGKDSEFDVEH